MDEVRDLIEMFNTKTLNKMKTDALMYQGLADMIHDRVASMFATKEDNHRIRYVYEIFPNLFEKEAKEIEQKRIQAELELYKAKLRHSAEIFNERFKKKGAG